MEKYDWSVLAIQILISSSEFKYVDGLVDFVFYYNLTLRLLFLTTGEEGTV